MVLVLLGAQFFKGKDGLIGWVAPQTLLLACFGVARSNVYARLAWTGLALSRHLCHTLFNPPCAKHMPSKQTAIVANLLNEHVAMIFAFAMIASIGYLICLIHRVELYSQHCVDDVAT